MKHAKMLDLTDQLNKNQNNFQAVKDKGQVGRAPVRDPKVFLLTTFKLDAKLRGT